jgi:Domain of unknown function DUF29
MATTYEKDVAAWAHEQAQLIRERRFDALDIEHLAEEIEDVSRSDKRELVSRLTVLLQHLLKWKFQPERRSPSWRATIVAQRDELSDLLEQSPSLRVEMETVLSKSYERAVKRAVIETGMTSFPSECPFAIGEIQDEAFWPE